MESQSNGDKNAWNLTKIKHGKYLALKPFPLSSSSMALSCFLLPFSSLLRDLAAPYSSPLIQAHFLKLNLQIKLTNGVRKVGTFNFKKGASFEAYWRISIYDDEGNLLFLCFILIASILLCLFRCLIIVFGN